jgi:hypothetical protein
MTDKNQSQKKPNDKPRVRVVRSDSTSSSPNPPTPPAASEVPQQTQQPSQPPVVINVPSGEGQRRAGTLGPLAGMSGCAVVSIASIVAIMVISLFFLDQMVGWAGEILPDLPLPGKPTDVVVDPGQLILGMLRTRSRLESAEQPASSTDIRVAVDQGNYCDHVGIFRAEGTTAAGIYLGSIDEDDISVRGQEITITIPPAQLMSCDIQTIDRYDQETNPFAVCNIDWDIARQLGEATALSAFRDQALEGGLLEIASAQAARDIETLLEPIGELASYTIRVEVAGDVPPADSTCDPSVYGWKYDIFEDKWEPTR